MGVGWLVKAQRKVGKGRQEGKEEVSRGIRRNMCRKIEEGRNAGTQERRKTGRWEDGKMGRWEDKKIRRWKTGVGDGR